MKAVQHARLAADRFDDWADHYGEDRISGWFQYFQKYALEQLAFTPTSTFLDVGCGPGWGVREASGSLPAGKAAGIDISPKMIDKAIALSKDYANCEFRVADSAAIPYPSGSFENVLSTFSFHHYRDPGASLKEIRRVTKTGGKFVVVDSARDVFFPIWLQDRLRRYLERSHVKYYTTFEMEALLNSAGFVPSRPMETVKRAFYQKKAFTGLMIFVCS